MEKAGRMSHRSQNSIIGIEEQKKLLTELLLQANQGEIYPASLAQQRLWFIDQLCHGTAAYNVHVGLWLYGTLNLPALQSSLQEIVNRHETLRTSFRLERGELIQVIDQTCPVSLSTTDFAGVPEPYPPTYELAKRQVETPFDLGQAPLFRSQVFRISAEEHVFLCTMHHAITDAWSMQVFVKEIALLYEAFSNGRPSPLPELLIRYGDYSKWQREWCATGALQQQLSYWKRRLQNAPPVLELPKDGPRPPEQKFEGAIQTVSLPSDIVASAKALAARYHVTPFMVLLTVFEVLLFRYTDQDDVLVGVPVAGRDRTETEGLIGLFVNTVVFRNELSGNPRFTDLLSQVRETALDAFANADAPFEKVVEEIQPERSLNVEPVFQVMFSVTNAALKTQKCGDLEVFPYIVDTETSILDLSMNVVQGVDEEAWIRIEYDTNLFRRDRISRMFSHYLSLLRGVVAQADARILDLPLLTGEERAEMAEWNNTIRTYPSDCIHERIADKARQMPHGTALRYEGLALTYADMEQRAKDFAVFLRDRGVRAGDVVAICVERSLDMVPAVLGILKTGAAYLAVHPASPRQRTEFMIRDSGAVLMITDRNLTSGAGPSSCPIAYVENVSVGLGQGNEEVPAAANLDSIAYVIYTSGSTGQPKGVRVPHRGIANLIRPFSERPGVSPDDRVLAVTSLSFDAATLELMVSLACGAIVVIGTSDAASDPYQLIEILGKEKITMFFATPATWKMLVGAGWRPANRNLKILCGAEVLTAELAAELLDRSDFVWNFYGPTETTIYSTCARVMNGSPVSIGRPVDNTQCYVLDRNLSPVPLGIPGELYIGGDGLARGYLNRPDLTENRFVPNPFDGGSTQLYRTGDRVRYLKHGELEYIGRFDSQIKLRGLRVEPGEIEAALLKHPSVRDAVVMARELQKGEIQIVAYIVPERDIALDELRSALRLWLPDYMVPSAFVILNSLPLTTNGKVDRRALPLPDFDAPRTREQKSATTPEEKKLVEIWRKLLPVAEIGIHDNFFDLGGHSMLAAQFIGEIRESTGIAIPVSALFRAPTIESFARLLQQDSISKTDPVVMPLHEGDGVIPFFAVAAPGVDTAGLALLARQMGKDQSVYKLQPPAPLVWDRPFTREELRDLARECIAAMCSVQPRGPYCLGGMCEGVVIAQQMIIELESQGEEVGLFAIFDTWVLENSQIRPLWAVDYYLQRFRIFRSQPSQERQARLRRVLKRLLRPSNVPDRSGWTSVYWPTESFQPPRFRAPVLLFKRIRQPYYYIRDRQMGWGNRSEGGVEICEINCRHIEVLRQPHVQTIGQKLASRLQRIRDRQPKSNSVVTPIARRATQ
jgi:amino acid adenylation domain-containing protein